MTDAIDALLLAWHDWQAGYRPHLGYPRRDATCGEYQSSTRQWMDLDDLSDEVDAKELNRHCEQIDLCVETLTSEERAAIHTEMRNRKSGAQVWRSGRSEHINAYRSAKKHLEPLFIKRGLLDYSLDD